MVLDNCISYKKIMCECTKVEEGIKLIYKKTECESITMSEFTKNKNVELFVEFLNKIVKIVKKDFINKKDKSISDMKEKDKILDLIIEYIEQVGFFSDISSEKNFIWKIEEINQFVKDVIKVFLIYEIHIVLCRDSVGYKQSNAIKFNTNIQILDWFSYYDCEFEDICIFNNRDITFDHYDMFNDYVYTTIKDEKITLNIKICTLSSNDVCVQLTSTNLYDLILYMTLQRSVLFTHKRHFYDMEDKTYFCKECGDEFNIYDNEYDFFPKNIKYCEECRDKLQQCYKNDYKEKIKIINELRQYKGKIPKEYNDLRNEYNRFMRLINNRKKGDKLPELNDLDKMLLKLKNIK